MTFQTYLSRLFASAKTPDLFGDISGVLTRQQSKDLVDRIAHAIHDGTASLGKPAAVAIYLPRDRFYLATIFAVWQSGNHYIPLNQAWPESYTRQILDDARPDLIVADTRQFEATTPSLSVHEAAAYGAPGVHLSSEWREKASAPGVAYVIYTSGSTGGQKGVVISKKALTSYVGWVERSLRPHQENQKLLISGEMSFDISIADLSFALAFETEIHVSPDPKNVLAHARLLKDRGIDTFYGVPTSLSRLLSWAATRRDLTFDSLKAVFSGGDVLTGGVVNLVHRLAPNARCYNMYGPTEVTMNCLYFPIGRSGVVHQGAVPTGIEFDHLSYALIDPESLSPVSTEGELIVSGDQCMDGYLHDPERTAAAFVDVGGKRYYRTGDLFQRDRDGVYSILGRIDSVVKVRGYRIDTATIDGVILGEGWIREAKSIAVRTAENDARIVAFLCATESPADYAEVLSKKCQAALPRYMVPAHFLRLEHLPLGQTGKVDTVALRELALQSLGASAG